MPSRPKPRPGQQALITDPARRRRLGASFSADTSLEEAWRYDAVRPRYPREVVAAMLELSPARRRVGADADDHVAHVDPADPAEPTQAADPAEATASIDAVDRVPDVVADLGAGTGILTRALLAQGAMVHAVEPSLAMTEVLAAQSADQDLELESVQDRLQVHRTTAESTGLGEASCDVVVAAQAWHWFDDALVQAEVRRILRPGGTLAVVANYLDTSVPWVHRLTRIMRAGDVYRPGWTPSVDAAHFGAWRTTLTRWQRSITPEQIRTLSTTLSSWLSADEPARERRRANLDWYLDEHLALPPGEPVQLPYLTVLHTSVLPAPA
ncbi:class I SAM-dependent methyltransferase [Nesterenkonia lutea]|uniref:SAM-dependent methyltransferase n=1 Tax=Nesterenkonia lutea TaxID=272919 RepID=A0ABR9JER6_9MICC|nr:class I SAM-dependent methyltransferase [Nesterenkonia lutea]MBE1524419.1 SAM-dependent methyltransferase [Nesterenkonia lutea]